MADEKKKRKKKPKGLIQTIGKRKSAIARAVLSPGKGIVRVNKKLLSAVTPTLSRDQINEPLILAGDVAKTVNISINVSGGGWQGQTEAARVAIGKALATHDKKLKKVFLDYDRRLLVSDIRRKETRKPNDSKARAKRQKSYR